MGGSTLLQAAQAFHNEKIPLFVGCTKQNLCLEVKKMPKTAQFYTEAPRQGEMRQLSKEELARVGRDSVLRSFGMSQRVPEGLAYVADSAVPPAQVQVIEGDTVLDWLWTDELATGWHTVTYAVEPVVEGVHTVRGDMRLADAGGLDRTLALPSGVITVSGPCDPLVTPPTPTATPKPPTFTPRPASPTPVPPTPTTTYTPVPKPVFLPVMLRMTCKPDERLGDIVLVIDMSTSMDRLTPDGVSKEEAVLDAARAFVSRLDFTPNERGQHDQVAVVGFNDEAWLEQSLTCDSALVEGALGDLASRQAQGTRLDLAFEAGLAALDPTLCQSGNKPVIILLTDGLPNRVPAHPDTGRVEDTVIEAARRAKDAGATVYTIGFGFSDPGADPSDQVNQWLLEQCASDPGKAYIDPRADRLREIYAEIADVFSCPPIGWP